MPMNMQFLPWANNALPEIDDDDPDRWFYRNEIKKLHKRVKIKVTEELRYNAPSYLCKRVGLISHLVLLLQQQRITKKCYIELSQMLNIDIIAELSKQHLIDNDGW